MFIQAHFLFLLIPEPQETLEVKFFSSTHGPIWTTAGFEPMPNGDITRLPFFYFLHPRLSIILGFHA
jgi:hypothetical protein